MFLNLVKNLQAVMVKTEIELFLSLSDSTEELCISLAIKTFTCLIQEGNRLLDVRVLATDQDSNDCIFDWVQLRC